MRSEEEIKKGMDQMGCEINHNYEDENDKWHTQGWYEALKWVLEDD